MGERILANAQLLQFTVPFPGGDRPFGFEIGLARRPERGVQRIRYPGDGVLNQSPEIRPFAFEFLAYLCRRLGDQLLKQFSRNIAAASDTLDENTVVFRSLD